MILRENLRYVIVSDKLSLVKLCEDTVSEGFLDCFEVYHPKPREDAVLPESVSEESVKMRMKVKSIASGLYGEDSSEFALIDTEHLRERSSSGTKEYGVELAVVLKEDPYSFWDCKDGVAMGDVFDNLAVDVFCELYCSLSTARGTYTSAFIRGSSRRRCPSLPTSSGRRPTTHTILAFSGTLGGRVSFFTARDL